MAKYNAEADASSHMAKCEQLVQYVAKTGISSFEIDMLGFSPEAVRDSVEVKSAKLLKPTYKAIDTWLIGQHQFHKQKWTFWTCENSKMFIKADHKLEEIPPNGFMVLGSTMRT